MKQNVWLVYGLDDDAEYSDMDWVYDICLTEEGAKRVMEEGIKKYHGTVDFWIDKYEAHD